MKILRIIYDWPPPWQGLAPHPYELTKAQVGLGHKFVIFCGHWPKAGQREKVDSVEFNTFVREPLPGTLTLTSSVFLFLYYLWWRFGYICTVLSYRRFFLIPGSYRPHS